MKQILLGVLLAFLVLGQDNTVEAFWRTCHIASPNATSVTSAQCTAAGCSFPRGGALTATIQWTSTAVHNTIENFIRYQDPTNAANWISIPVTPPLNNACASMTPGCPTVVGRTETLNLNIPIPAFIPAVPSTNFEIWLTAITPAIANVVCVQVTAELT